MIPNLDIGGAGLVLGRSIVGQRQETLCKVPGYYRAGDRGTSGHAGHVVLCYHTEYLAGPGT